MRDAKIRIEKKLLICPKCKYPISKDINNGKQVELIIQLNHDDNLGFHWINEVTHYKKDGTPCTFKGYELKL